MSQMTDKPFDCLGFKWRVQAEVYQEIKDQTPEEQIDYFHRHADAGPFAELVRMLREHQVPDR
jgi:hypothetical protein